MSRKAQPALCLQVYGTDTLIYILIYTCRYMNTARESTGGKMSDVQQKFQF